MWHHTAGTHRSDLPCYGYCYRLSVSCPSIILASGVSSAIKM